VASIHHKYKDNLPEGSNFDSTSARGCRYFIFACEFAPQVSTHALANNLSGSQEFYKKMKINLVVGKILVNDIQFTKFAKVFPCHNFALYSSF